MTLAPGTKLGRYEIRAKIGAGGMGEVYLAEDTQLQRRVAIKLLSPQTVSDEHAGQRLVREARAVAKLDHPNICSIYEVGEADGRRFIAMQYLEGETLDLRLKLKPLELKESLTIASQIADAADIPAKPSFLRPSWNKTQAVIEPLSGAFTSLGR